MIERVEHLPVPKSIMGIISYRDWDRLAIEVRVRESVIIVNVVELITLGEDPKIHSTHVIPLPLPEDGVMSDSFDERHQFKSDPLNDERCLCGEPWDVAMHQ